MTSAGAWDHLYRGATQSHPWGPTLTYHLGAQWLAPCPLVEDWGCGLGAFAQHRSPLRTRGIDASLGPYTTQLVDLTLYKSTVPGVMMRHVLEHNEDWRSILHNACQSFTQRMFLVMFTPINEPTHVIKWTDIGDGTIPVEIPDIAINALELDAIMNEHDIIRSWERVDTDAGYGPEHICRMSKP